MHGIGIIDWIIIAAYFIGTIWIGKMATKRVGSTSEFLIGSGKIGKFQSAVSVAASDIGGSSLIGAAALSYTLGISGSFWNLCAIPAWLFLGFFMAGGFRKLALTTVPELLEKRYNKIIRLIAAVLSLLSGIMSITTQIVVASLVFTTITGIPEIYTAIFAIVVFVAYTAAGGLIAVIWTDIMHYFVLIAGVVLTAVIGFHLTKGWNHIASTVPASYWSFGKLGWSTPIGWALMCFFIYSTTQTYIQRLFAAKDESSAKFACYFTGANYLLYGLLVSFIGIIGYVLVPGLKDSQMVLPEMIRTILPNGVKGLVLAAILAATMNCSASALNSCTALFTIDIYKRFLNANVSDKKLLFVSRMSTIGMAVIATIISYSMKSIVDIVVLCGLIYSAGVFFPILIGMYNKRVNSFGALTAIFFGGCAALISNFKWYGKIDGLFGIISPYVIGGIVSLILLLVISYITPPPSKENNEFLDSLNLSKDEIKKKVQNLNK